MTSTLPIDPLRLDPAREALARQATQALSGGRLPEARRLLEQALSLGDDDPTLRLQLAGVCRGLQDFTAAMTHVEASLRFDPRDFTALLLRALLLERSGTIRPSEVSAAYGRALTQVPPEEQLDTATRRAVQHARMVNHQHQEKTRSHIRQRLTTLPLGPAERARIELFTDATLGLRQIYRQQPVGFEYPGLPAIEFYERDEFPWLAAFEARTPRIQQELAAVLSTGEQGFTPYVDYGEHIPMDQWLALNRSPDWNAFHFFHQGQRYEDNCRRCPETMAALADVPQPHATGRMPAAMFSVLKPGVRIPPHTGVANVRLVVHLPLVVPRDCGIRVGNTTRAWRIGEALVFDDTIEHEAWNLSDELRVVLICDVWSPRLGAADREMIVAMLAAMDEYNGFAGETGL